MADRDQNWILALSGAINYCNKKISGGIDTITVSDIGNNTYLNFKMTDGTSFKVKLQGVLTDTQKQWVVDNYQKLITNTDGQLEYDGRPLENVIIDVKTNFPTTGTNNVLYVDTTDNSTYRWDDTTTSYIKLSGGSGLIMVDDYSQLPTTMTSDAIYFVKNSYEDTSVTPSVTYISGFYLWDNDLTIPSWVLISTSQDSESIISIDETELITIKEKTKEERQELYKNNILFVVGDSKLVFYNRNLDSFVDCKTDNTEVPLWKSNKLYKVNDLVKYNEETYKCIVEHTSGETFDEDEIKWIIVLEQYYALKQSQYDKLVNDGVINDNTRALYVITNATEQKEDNSNTIQIVNTLPTPSKDIENFVYFLHTDNHLYKCIEDPDNLGTYIMKDVTVSGGSAVLSSDLTSNVEVGGVPKNKTYAKDTPLETIVRDILNKYIEPTVALAINPNKTVYKKGDTLNPLDIKATVTKNSNDIVSIKYYVDATLVDTKDSSTDSTLPTGGIFTYQYTTDITTDSTIKIVVNDSTKDVTKTVKIIFVNPYYVGASATNVVTSTTGLTETVEDKCDKTINYVCNNEYAVFMYPSSYGNITTILDENGFNCTTDFTLSTTTINSVSYNVYVSNNQLTTSGFKYTFKL